MADALSTEVVEAIAEARDCDPVELEISLENHIPTDALRQLAVRDDASWTLSFKVPKHNVTVTSDGLILVDGVYEEVWA